MPHLRLKSKVNFDIIAYRYVLVGAVFPPSQLCCLIYWAYLGICSHQEHMFLWFVAYVHKKHSDNKQIWSSWYKRQYFKLVCMFKVRVISERVVIQDMFQPVQKLNKTRLDPTALLISQRFVDDPSFFVRHASSCLGYQQLKNNPYPLTHGVEGGRQKCELHFLGSPLGVFSIVSYPPLASFCGGAQKCNLERGRPVHTCINLL